MRCERYTVFLKELSKTFLRPDVLEDPSEVLKFQIPSSKLTWQRNMDHLKMYFLLKMGIFHCHVSLPEGI